MVHIPLYVMVCAFHLIFTQQSIFRQYVFSFPGDFPLGFKLYCSHITALEIYMCTFFVHHFFTWDLALGKRAG